MSTLPTIESPAMPQLQEAEVKTSAETGVTTDAVGAAGSVDATAPESLAADATSVQSPAETSSEVPSSTPAQGSTTGPSTATATATGTPESTDTDRDAVTVVITPPKTTEELIAARAIKRIARKTALRQLAKASIARGDAYMEIKNYKAASHAYLEAIELCRTDPDYFIKLAGSYRKLKWYEEAAHAATRALTLNPKHSEARYVRGVARLEQRLLKPAKTDFEMVLAHDPTHLVARAALTEVNHFISTSKHLGSHTLSSSPIDAIVKDVDFSFPPYDFEGEDDGEMSDSSDCAHVGNGVPCRFHNHEGCRRGAECQFSHAPDERSVRDDLGKNVCIYHILSSCKFGAAKCIYSHDKAALPKRGWWTSDEQIERVRVIVETSEQKAREQRAKESERWKAKMKSKAAAKGQTNAKVPADDGEKDKDVAEGVADTEEPQKSPNSATGGKGRRQQPKAAKNASAEVVEGEELPKSAGVATKGKPRPRKVTKKKTAGPAAHDSASKKSNPDESAKQNVGSEFTDYTPMGPPPSAVVADTISDAPLTLSY